MKKAGSSQSKLAKSEYIPQQVSIPVQPRHHPHLYIPHSALQLPFWQSAWASASILLLGTTSYLDLRQPGSPGFWHHQPLKDRDLDAREPGTVKTPACISDTGALCIPSPGPDFADSPQQLGTTLQGHTRSSSTGKSASRQL